MYTSGEGGLMEDGMLGANTLEEPPELVDSDTDIEGETKDREEAPVRRAPNPSDPTPEERETHNATHRPFRPWCPVCVKAMGREDPHYRKTTEERKRGMPTMAMDYAAITEQEKAPDGTTTTNSRTILVGRDKWTKHTFSYTVKCKGLGDDKVVKKVLKSIDETGNTRMILKGDGEPALVQVQEAVKEKRSHETVLQNPPAYDPQSNGMAERAVQEVKGQIRMLKLGLESRIKRTVKLDEKIMEWLVTHASGVINSFLPGAGGRTAYYRVLGRKCEGKTFEIGEQVWVKPKRKITIQDRSNLAARWLDGTWVGYDHRSHEHLIVLADGGPAIRVRSVRARPASERWSAAAIDHIKATGDQPNPSNEEQEEINPEGRTQGMEFEDTGENLPEAPTQEREVQRRDFGITRELLDKYSYTPGCPGCKARQQGKYGKHNRECKRRIEEAMKAEEPDDERLWRRDRRFFEEPQAEDNEVIEANEDVDANNNTEEVAAEVNMEESEGQIQDVDADTGGEAKERPERNRGREEENEGDEGPTAKRQRVAEVRKLEHQGHETRRDEIEKTVKNVIKTLIKGGETYVSQLCTKEIVETIVNDLDKQCTRKIERNIKRQEARGKTGTGADVAEAYSQPRMTSVAEKLGYKKGFAMDLLTNDDEGRPWDLSKEDVQKRAMDKLEKEMPWLLVVSPPCTWFSTLQRWNFPKMTEEKVHEGMKQALLHVAFAVILCKRQAQAGRKFMFEHPAGASSWRTSTMATLMKEPGVHKVEFDFCMMGMTSTDAEGKAAARKRTGILTNSKALADELRKMQCSRDHRHVALTGGRAGPCQKYPEEFCRKVCDTVMKEKTGTGAHAGFLNQISMTGAIARDVTETINNLMKHLHDQEEEDWYQGFEFFDDVTGGKLNHKLAVKARKLEMEFFKRMKVYDKVPRWMARQAGCKVISTRWLDISKGDYERPDYRLRLVGRELAIEKRLDLFAATPPLESLRMACAVCASNQDRHNPFRIMAVDVKRAYFYAKAQRPVFIEIPAEDRQPGDENMVGKLSLSLYGTRDAAQNWATEYTNFLQSIGFKKGKASPCNFDLAEREIMLTAHGDDFTITGPLEQLKWMAGKMQEKYDIKHNSLGPEEEGLQRDVKVLNRTLR